MDFKKTLEELEKDKKLMRAFAFDSLVYRFKDYQSKAFQSEVNNYKYKTNTSELEARKQIFNLHHRDLMKFIEILNIVMGEHE